MPKRERRTALALNTQINEQGYAGGYTRVADFIRERRQNSGKAVAIRAFVPLKFELGEAFQFDGSEEGLVVGGIYRRLQVAHLKLCASRAFRLGEKALSRRTCRTGGGAPGAKQLSAASARWWKLNAWLGERCRALWGVSIVSDPIDPSKRKRRPASRRTRKPLDSLFMRPCDA